MRCPNCGAERMHLLLHMAALSCLGCGFLYPERQAFVGLVRSEAERRAQIVADGRWLPKDGSR